MNPICPLLGLLYKNERHGYELKRIVDQEFSPFWKIDFAQLYRSLSKLSKSGWVRVRVASGSGGPKRKIYALTPPGRHAFQAWLAQEAVDRNEFFVKIRLASDCGLPVPALLNSQRNKFSKERTERDQAHSRARAEGQPGRLMFAHAALRETDTALAALDLYAATTSTRGANPRPNLAPVIMGSDDPLLSRLVQLAHTSTQAVGSIAGLVALAQHQANVAGVHLLDAETGEYNIPFVKHLVPEDEIVLVNLAVRENGLLVAHGNPKDIRSVRSLGRKGVRFINRQRGAGTRLLLLSKLRAAHIDPHLLPDWERIALTHDAVAGAIAAGTADVGPGLRAVAAEWDLDFIPLGEERYDLAVSRAEFESLPFRELLSVLHSRTFLQQASDLQGYDLTRTGQVIARIK